MTEETQIWVRMAMDRQLLALQHAQLLLQLDNVTPWLATLLADITDNLQALQKIYSGSNHF